MVSHFNFVARRAAIINDGEFARVFNPTGYSRTYPNYVAAESARGNEFNAWSVGNPPCMKPFYHLQDFWEAQWIIRHYFEIK
jgi:hypothetical protein